MKYKKPLQFRTSIYVDTNRFPDLRYALLENLKNSRKLKKNTSRNNRKNGANEMATRNRDKLYIDAFNCLMANLILAHLQQRSIEISRSPSHYRNKKSNPKKISATVLNQIVDMALVNSDRIKSKQKKKINLNNSNIRINEFEIIEKIGRGYFDRTGKKKSKLSLYITKKLFGIFLPKSKRKAGQVVEFTKPLHILSWKKTDRAKRVERYKWDIDDIKQELTIDENLPDVVATANLFALIDEVNLNHKYHTDFVHYEPPVLIRKFGEDYKTHGRIYCEGGAFQNWNSEAIKNLRIDDEAVTELDFSGTHINIIYALKGIRPADEAYQLAGLIKITDYKFRHKLGKIFVNIMLNADSKQKAEKAIRGRLADECIKYGPAGLNLNIKGIIQEIEKKHSDISDQFYTGVGLSMQFIESKICMFVLDVFARKSKPIIPKHDSFVVKKSDRELLALAMKNGWKYVIKGQVSKAIVVQDPKITEKY